jgi:formate hydrogenlyase subunit 6/NADH:ubiquinone oxidoreductase subunit I
LTVDMDRCIACLQCMRICPDHCISIEQEKRDADGSARRSPTRSASSSTTPGACTARCASRSAR